LEEARNEQKENAFATKAKGSSRFVKGKETRSCYKCGKKGHIAKDCWSKKQDKGDQNRTDSKLNMTASVFDSDSDLKNAWLIDSGASSHICCRAELFEELNTKRRPHLDGLGGGVQAEGVGTVKPIITATNMTLTLKAVHFVPSFFTNLLSVKRFKSSEDARLTYDGSTWKLVHTPTGTVAIAKDYRGMFALDAYVQNEFVQAVMEPIDLWHARLGHISIGRVKQAKDVTRGIIRKSNASMS
jgi:hypothetical protein